MTIEKMLSKTAKIVPGMYRAYHRRLKLVKYQLGNSIQDATERAVNEDRSWADADFHLLEPLNRGIQYGEHNGCAMQIVSYK